MFLLYIRCLQELIQGRFQTIRQSGRCLHTAKATRNPAACGIRVRLILLYEHEQYFTLTHRLPIHRRPYLTLTAHRGQPKDFRFQNKVITRFHHTAEPYAVDPAKHRETSFVFFILQNRHRTCLCERFRDEYARKDRVAGKMPLKAKQIFPDMPHRFGAFCHFAFEHLVQKQERIAVRNNLFDCFLI